MGEVNMKTRRFTRSDNATFWIENYRLVPDEMVSDVIEAALG
jgi:hypothetical protein